jgi:hypothetical protein
MKPTLIVNGQVAGIWKQIRRRDRIMISIEPFRKRMDGGYRSLEKTADRYRRFYDIEAELHR